jgi:hypothetical protein
MGSEVFDMIGTVLGLWNLGYIQMKFQNKTPNSKKRYLPGNFIMSHNRVGRMIQKSEISRREKNI